MFLNNLIKFILLGLCLGNKKETVSSRSFHQDGAPLSHKYNSLNGNLIDKPRKQNDPLIDYFRHHPKIIKSIQYAPLQPEETLHHHADIKNLNSYQDQPRDQSIENKVNLEPRAIENSENKGEVTPANFLQYIEGHNIVVPLKRHKDNEDGHDVLSEKNKYVDQIEYENSLLKYKVENPEPKKHAASFKAISKGNARVNLKKQQTLTTKGYPTKSYQVLSALENSQIEPVNAYVKVPRLHLNIARAYNFAKLPFKASLMGRPKNTFVPDNNILRRQKKFLHPVDNNKLTLRS